MHVQKILIKDFRNIKEETIVLSNKTNIFYGQNAQGKTNLLEALYLCAVGRSMRTNIENEMINFSSSQAKIKIILSNNETIEVHLFSNQKKIIYVNGFKINKLGELFGKLPSVIFCPDDLQLIKSNPSVRRKFMDTEICQINKIYYYELKQYYRALHQRNNLLKKIHEGKSSRELLEIWDTQLILHGINIVNARENFIKKIDARASEIYFHITSRIENLKTMYKPNATAQNFADKIKKHYDYDIFVGSTSNGIHKDDLIFEIDNKPAKIYGSQGQQKSVSLALKLAEINLIHENTNKSTILLLDDILSELDESRQRFLLDAIKNLQVILTCTGLESTAKKEMITANFFCVKSGKFFNKNGV